MSEVSPRSSARPPRAGDRVWIPEGEFAMGSERHYPEEGPVRRVAVSGFWIEVHPVTNDRYAEPGLIAGFLRLSLPNTPQSGSRAFLPEIAGNAMIREVHVYGPALGIGAESSGQPQHAGLGTRLLDAARQISRAAGHTHISVIAATGTQAYYAARGFDRGDLYMTAPL